MSFAEFLHYLPELLHGILVTLELSICSLILGLGLAIGMTYLSYTRSWLARKLINAFVYFIRGTPLLVQIFLIYYGLGQFAWLRATPLWYLFQSPFSCAIIALALSTCGYTTALLRGALNSVPHNEIDGCFALGMSKSLAFRRIIFPRAFRIALPAYSNEAISLMQNTSLASTITLIDLMGATQSIIAQTYATLPLLIIAGVFYLILNSLLIGGFKFLEKRAAVLV